MFFFFPVQYGLTIELFWGMGRSWYNGILWETIQNWNSGISYNNGTSTVQYKIEWEITMGIVWRYFLDIPEWGWSIMGYIDMMENTCWEYQWIHHPKTVHHIQPVFLNEWQWLLTRRWLGSTAKITTGCHGSTGHGIWAGAKSGIFPQRCSKPRVRPHKKQYIQTLDILITRGWMKNSSYTQWFWP